MFNDAQVKDLQRAFKRIFAMPITRSTYRELQNAVMAVTGGDVGSSNQLFQGLLTGNAHDELTKKGAKKEIEDFIENFSISTRTARDVFEKGEFINLVSTDILNRQNHLVFLTRIRRVDGEELQFITDPEGAINYMNHLVTRLGELNRNPQTKHILPNYSDQLKTLQAHIGTLLSGSTITGEIPVSEEG